MSEIYYENHRMECLALNEEIEMLQHEICAQTERLSYKSYVIDKIVIAGFFRRLKWLFTGVDARLY